ncbi:uncharacterized protein LOC120985443 [Bufo bufo]|uniref:uncharacterized protein LOC120985014 n=1 Tax=Bufo bufo TaxID=8384 RepID=UPI001ABDDCAD|nr:uncharacterized protein LOC120985014 [Bufo bufo]XP_040269397.1 uncharacterized protein LOC120985015 [Bufo bufo]XP_040269445.1 uncharacterized protein LOC120985441 [Bufo bufo]XP_040269446.1 uncharacterized protein LOC120985442 [Bufo bufo]XP_040269447.1 uncharacterized protein LOC120985443 [Bufo bufo]
MCQEAKTGGESRKHGNWDITHSILTFPGSGRTTPGPDSAGANNIMYRVVLPLVVFLLVAAVIIIFCCYKYKAWRRREQKQAADLEMVRVEKPVVQKPVVQIKKKKNIRPPMDNIKKVKPIIERIKAAKKAEDKIIRITSKTEEETIMKVTSKTEEEITKRTSRLKRFRKWIKKSTQKKNMGKEKERTNHLCKYMTTCCSCRSMD